jgi:hypothetical protein
MVCRARHSDCSLGLALPTVHQHTHLEFKEGPEGLRLELRQRPQVLTWLFTAAWTAGWLLVAASTVATMLRSPGVGAVAAWWLAAWMIAGLASGLALVWLALGRREAIAVGSGGLTIERHAGGFVLRRRFRNLSADHIQVVEPQAGPLRDYRALRGFWTWGGGRLAIRIAASEWTIGTGLTDEEAAHLQREIAFRLARSGMDPARPRRLVERAGLLAIGMTMPFMLLAPVTLGARLAATDLHTCTGGSLARPYTPIDLGDERPDGRISLVPVGAFPPADLDALARHFRRKYAMPIDVEAALDVPDDALDVRRQQLISDVILEALEARYPSEHPPRVVIGVTGQDMYMDGVSWRYAFSHRRNDRFAVVSTARMDYGCLGIVAADGDQRRARLRRMVGKNIGVLYYRLPLSGNPRSMLYASIGGPQELDRMSDEF